MKKLVLVSFVLILITGSTYAKTESKTYPATLKKYLEACGSIETFQTVLKNMIGSFRSMHSSVPGEVWDEVEKEFSATSIDDLVDMLAPVYEKHLTEADLKEIIKFYNTSAGKKIAQKTPAIMQDSMEAGKIWGMKIGEKVMNKLKEKGY